MKRLVVTADDFGLSAEVNEAVERAHREGILTAASLMVAGPAAADAVARARRLPSLRVGLHLVLVEGRPALPPEHLPDLVGPDGAFRADMAALGATIFFKPAARRQVRAEIAAQFRAYQATGLPLDHVNAHKHYHLHPTIASALLAIGPDFGMRALRVPVEPATVLARVEPGRRSLESRVAAPFARLLARRVRGAGIRVPDQVLGLAWSGAMTAERVAGLLQHLPPGLTELYTHPATVDTFPGHAPGYRYRAELAALTAPATLAAARSGPIALGGYSDF